MLILSRTPSESIIIGDPVLLEDENIVITVLSVRGKQVRLGISAPKSVQVHREEISQRIAASKKPAKVPA